MQRRLALVPVPAVDVTSASNASPRRLRDPLRVGGAADSLLEAVGVADHRRVEACPGHHGEALLFEAPHVELTAIAAKPNGDRLFDVRGYSEVRREEVRRAGRQDGQGRLGASKDVHAPSHRAVTAPGEDELRSLVQRTLDLR